MNHRLQDFFLSEVLDVGLQSLNFTPLDPCPLDDSRTRGRTREGAFLARTLMLSPCRRAVVLVENVVPFRSIIATPSTTWLDR